MVVSMSAANRASRRHRQREGRSERVGLLVVLGRREAKIGNEPGRARGGIRSKRQQIRLENRRLSGHDEDVERKLERIEKTSERVEERDAVEAGRSPPVEIGKVCLLDR